MLQRTASRYVVVGLLLTMMGVLSGIFAPGQAETDLGVVDTRLHLPVVVTTTLLYVLLLSGVIAAPARYLHSAVKQAVLLPLLLFCAASAAWSSDPLLVMRRLIFLLFTVGIAIVIGTDFSVPEIGRMLAIASMLHLALCAMFLVFARHYLFGGDDPTALRGLTTHKNVFGFEQGLAVIVFLFCPFKRMRILRWPLAMLAGGALLWSHSSGSLVATVAALLMLPFLLVSRLKAQERLPLMGLVTAAFVALMTALTLFIDRIPALFSKDATLTGRTDLWKLVIVAINNHPWLGYGFDSFWRGLQGDSLTIIRSVGWLVPTAHNGYLDLLLSVGIIGAVLFAPVLFRFIYRALVQTTMGQDSGRFFPAIFLVFLLIYNLNESALLTRSGLPFFLFVALGTAMTKPRSPAARLSLIPSFHPDADQAMDVVAA
jgi:exopolysaccharide production protein ExoQ